MNVCFEYLYCDAGNNKLWGSIIFSNERGTDVAALRKMFEPLLIDGQFFPRRANLLPTLQFPEHDEELDHAWLEYVGIMGCADSADDVQGRDVEGFIGQLVECLEHYRG